MPKTDKKTTELNLLEPTTPNIWVIGDVQGCYQQLQSLLNHPEIRDDPNCKLWFAGDIINRGKGSLETLQCIMELGDKAITILGNHDIHCLAVAAGFRKEHQTDTLADILQSKHRDDYIEWLRHRPLAHYDYEHLMVHAGVMQPWTAEMTMELAEEVSKKTLKADDWQQKLAKLFGNEPNYWDDSFTGNKRRRVVINALTRMRMCHIDGSMDFDYKGAPPMEPPNSKSKTLPWFELPNRQSAHTTVVFGHWSTLGLLIRPNLLALDTGCVWGGSLTALRLNDRKLIQIPYFEGEIENPSPNIWTTKNS